MAVNTLEIAENLQARTDLSARAAQGIAYAISRAVEGFGADLVTRDHLDARLAETDVRIAELRAELKTDIAELRTELRTEIAALRAEIAGVRTEIHQAIRAQTPWMATTMIAVAGVIIAAVKLIP